jgi:hypothetical protein
LDQKYAEAASRIMGPSNIGKISPWQTLTVAGGGAIGTASAPGLGAAFGLMLAGTYGPYVKRVTQAILTGKRPKVIDNEIMQKALMDAMAQTSQGKP